MFTEVREALLDFDGLARFVVVLGLVFPGFFFPAAFCVVAGFDEAFFVLVDIADALAFPAAGLLLRGLPVDFVEGGDFSAMVTWRIIAQTGYSLSQPSPRLEVLRLPVVAHLEDAVQYKPGYLIFIPRRVALCSKSSF